MGVWLVDVPEYAVLFTQCVLACNILGVFSSSFYIPMMAANKIRFNSVASVFLGILQFIALYFILRGGGGALWVPVVSIVIAIGFSYFVKPYILYKDINYSIKELSICYWNCAKVLVPTLMITIPCKYFLDDSIFQSIIMFIVTMIVVGSFSFIFMEKDIRNKVIEIIKNKIHHK